MRQVAVRERWLRPLPGRRWVWASLLTAGALASAGCRPPTWSELIGAKKEEPPPPVVPINPPVMPTPPVNQTPPPPNPAEIVARFKKMPTFEIDDAALNHLTGLDGGLEDVTELTLTGSKVTNRGLTGLGKLTALAKLDVRGSLIDQAGMASIAQATNLEELRVDGSKMTDDAVAALRPLSNLKYLDLTGAQLTAAGYAELLHLQTLEELVLDRSSIRDESLAVVAEVRGLKRLRLRDTAITDAGLAQLGKLDELQRLNVTGCRIHGTGFSVIAKKGGLKSLDELTLESTLLNEAGAKALRQMTQLDTLNLGGNPTMGDQHLVAMIKGLPKLRVLNLHGNPGLTGACMLAVKGSDSIEHVILNNCQNVDDSAFIHLKTCKNLKRVEVGRTRCTANGALQLRKFLPDVVVDGIGS